MDRRIRFRAALLLILFAALVLLFGNRLFRMQIVETGGKADNTKTFTTYTRVKAARGDILDKNGNVLVTNRASYDLMLNHFVILSADNTAERILSLVRRCRELGVEYVDHLPVSKTVPFTYTLSEYNSTWQGYFQAYLPVVGGGLDSDMSAPVLMKKLRAAYKLPEEWSDLDAREVIGVFYELRLRRDLTPLTNYIFLEDVDAEVLAAIMELNVPGLTTEASTVREYNTSYGAHILGYCAPMTAEQWEYYGSLEDQKYEMDALVGQSGLEKAFESYLHGTDGTRVDVVTVDGTVIDQYYLDGAVPQAGKNVELSVDLNIQIAAENALENLIHSLRDSVDENGDPADGHDVEGGAVVVMEVKTGRILACASYPTYNLQTFQQDFEELKETPFAPMFNRALQAAYPPGSTYKVSMTIAGFQAGFLDVEKKIKDRGVFDKYIDEGFKASCLAWTSSGGTHGDIDVMEALSKSCNYFFYEVGDNIGLSVMDETAKNLGLGEPTGVELGEELGHRANKETKSKLYKGSEGHWFQADQILASIGQSDNRFTPMQLCVYACTLANRGTRYKATFLNQVVSSDYRKLEYVNEPEILSTMEISDEAYYAYTTGMRKVAMEGTAHRIFENYPIAVAAKTGTAQHTPNKEISDHGSFICYAPFDDPEIAVAVYGEKAGHGTTMGQIAKAVLDCYFDNPEVGDVATTENELS